MAVLDLDLGFDDVDLGNAAADVVAGSGVVFPRAGAGRVSLAGEVREGAAVLAGCQRRIGAGTVRPGLVRERADVTGVVRVAAVSSALPNTYI